MERILLAFSHIDTASKLRRMLDGTGFEPDTLVCRTGAELLRAAENYDSVLIIMGYKLPDMTAVEIAEYLHEGCRIMSIVRAEHIDDIGNEDIFVLPLPVNRNKLISSLRMLLRGAEPERRKEKSESESALISEAKLFLMETYHMTEPQAHRFMQKRSMDSGSKLIDTARLILGIEE